MTAHTPIDPKSPDYGDRDYGDSALITRGGDLGTLNRMSPNSNAKIPMNSSAIALNGPPAA